MEVREYHKKYVEFMKNRLFRDIKFCITSWDLEFMMRDIMTYNNISYCTANQKLYRCIEVTFINSYMERVKFSPDYWLLRDDCMKSGRLAFKLLPYENNWEGYQTDAQCFDLLKRCIVHEFNSNNKAREVLNSMC